tara:strand:+ start:6299 stop:6550 length:252 start_codon:yes stop_codon:yes gene_type:complete
MKIIDNLILIPWLLGFINLTTPFDNIYLFWTISIIFYGLVFAHLVESIIFRKKIINGPKGPWIGFSLTLVYGVLFLKTFSQKS